MKAAIKGTVQIVILVTLTLFFLWVTLGWLANLPTKGFWS
jgi:hypothetical protein